MATAGMQVPILRKPQGWGFPGGFEWLGWNGSCFVSNQRSPSLEEWARLFSQGAAMEALSLAFASALNYGLKSLKSAVSSASTTPPPQQKIAKTSSGSGDFDATLKALLAADGQNKVSEEDVFSALVQERIGKEKGQDALKTFQDLLQKSRDAHKKADGFVPVEDATKDALRKFRDTGAISQEEADKIYSQSFAAAQLDSNKDALFDSRGGPGDSSVAVATLEEALLASRTVFTAFDAGTETAAVRSLDETSAGKPKGADGGHVSEPGAGQFLFKPISDSDGRLAILLPPKLAGLVSGVKLIGPGGKDLESGRYAGNGNGGRDHYRFNQPGGNYPDGLTVEVALKTGQLVRYLIRETSQRTENITAENGNGNDGSSSNGGSSGDNSL